MIQTNRGDQIHSGCSSRGILSSWRAASKRCPAAQRCSAQTPEDHVIADATAGVQRVALSLSRCHVDASFQVCSIGGRFDAHITSGSISRPSDDNSDTARSRPAISAGATSVFEADEHPHLGQYSVLFESSRLFSVRFRQFLSGVFFRRKCQTGSRCCYVQPPPLKEAAPAQHMIPLGYDCAMTS